MKWIFVFICVLFVFFSLSGCADKSPTSSNNNDFLETSSSELVKTYYSLDELAVDSPTVILGKVTGEGVKFEYSQVVFVKTTIEVSDVLRDNSGINPGDSITLLQTDMMKEDPLATKNDQVLLFLKKYIGPVIEDAYGIVGAGYGHFVIEEGKILPKESNLPHLIQTSDFALTDIKNVLEKVYYIEPEYKTTTAEEIERANEEERRLLEEKMKSQDQ